MAISMYAMTGLTHLSPIDRKSHAVCVAECMTAVVRCGVSYTNSVYSKARWMIPSSVLNKQSEVRSLLHQVQQDVQRLVFHEEPIDDASATPFDASLLSTVARKVYARLPDGSLTGDQYRFAPSTYWHCEGGYGNGQYVLLWGGVDLHSRPPTTTEIPALYYVPGACNVRVFDPEYMTT